MTSSANGVGLDFFHHGPGLLEQNYSSREQGICLTSPQSQVDSLVGNFVEQATDWRSLTAMMAGGMTSRLGRMGAMAAGTGRLASLGLGLGAEVTAFEMTNRALMSLNPPNPPLTKGGKGGFSNLWRWEGQGGIRQGLLSSLITFGSLKGAGRLAQGESVVVQHLLQDTGMVLGHQISGAFGITPRPTGSLAEQFLHAEATNLQLGAGMALAHSVAPGIQGIERGLDLSLRGTEIPPTTLWQRGAREDFLKPALAIAGKASAVDSESSSPLVFMAKRPSSGGSTRDFSGLSLRQLIREASEKNDPEAAEELARRAQEDPRQFFQGYEIVGMIGTLFQPRDPRLVKGLLEALRRIIRGAYGVLDERHLSMMVQLSGQDPTLARSLNPMIKKLRSLRPGLEALEALREFRPDLITTPASEGRIIGTGPEEVQSGSFTFTPTLEKVRITAEKIEEEGLLYWNDDRGHKVRKMPARIRRGEEEASFSSEHLPPRFYATPVWKTRIETIVDRIRSGYVGAEASLALLLQEYVTEPSVPFSFGLSGDTKFLRLSRLTESPEPEIQKALREVDISWLIEESIMTNLPRFLLRTLAEGGHRGALFALVDLANKGHKFAKLLLRKIEMNRLVDATLQGDRTAHADLVHLLSLKDLTFDEAERAVEGLLRMAEKALGAGNSTSADFALAKLYDLSISDHREMVFEWIEPYEGTLFQDLQTLASNSSLNPDALIFLKEAVRMTSFEALEVLIVAARKDPNARAVLREILRETPYEDLPEVMEVSSQITFEAEMEIHIQMRQQKIRKKLVEALEELLRQR